MTLMQTLNHKNTWREVSCRLRQLSVSEGKEHLLQSSVAHAAIWGPDNVEAKSKRPSNLLQSLRIHISFYECLNISRFAHAVAGCVEAY